MARGAAMPAVAAERRAPEGNADTQEDESEVPPTQQGPPAILLSLAEGLSRQPKVQAPVLLASSPQSKKAGGSSPPRCASTSPKQTTSPTRTTLRRLSLSSGEARLQTKAHGVRSSFKRPRWWVLAFGWSLAASAGTVNVVAFRNWDVYVSHMTGITTAIGMRIEGVHQRETEFSDLSAAILLLCSFWLGAFACGMLIDKNSVHFGGKSFYGFALVCNGLLLLLATFTSARIVAACFAAAACGLQNAMCTSHFGAVVRTTHVTGTVTDIGSTLGRLAMIYLRMVAKRRRLNVLESAEVHVDARKLLVLLPMWCSYLSGTVLGAYLYTYLQVDAMLLPALFTLFVGLLYMCFRQRLKGYLKQLEHERMNRDMEKVMGTLERAQTALREFHEVRHAGGEALSSEARSNEDDGDGIVMELGDGIEDMLERMRVLEENISIFCHSPRSMPGDAAP